MSEPAAPDSATLETFWKAAKAARPDRVRGDRYRTRAIGTTPQVMTTIINLVLQGEKRGTFSLPALHDKNPGTAPVVDDYVILIDYDGKPGVLVTTTEIEHVPYRDITGAHTAIDGPSVRPLDVWQGVHKPHWTKQLGEQGLEFSEDMPVMVEHFQCVYPEGSDPKAATARGLDALPQGPARPSLHALDAFWRAVLIVRPDLTLPKSYEVRWIGIDPPTTETIFGFILEGTKVATFRLPLQLKARGHDRAKVGDPIVLIAYDGTPRMAIRVTEIEEVTFATVEQRHSGLDGPPVQDIAVWQPLHRGFWTKDLVHEGLQFSEDMPVVVEKFELIYPKP